MNISQTIRRFRIPILMSVVVLPAAVFAFAAANTVPLTAGGEGSSQISGYTTSNIHYVLNATNPELVDNVTFDLVPDVANAPNPGVVKAKLAITATYASATSVTSGTNTSSWNVALVPQMAVSDINSLSIIAAQ